MENTAIEGISNEALAAMGIFALLLWIALTSQEENGSVGSAIGKLIALIVKVAVFAVGTGIIVSVLLGFTAGI